MLTASTPLAPPPSPPRSGRVGRVHEVRQVRLTERAPRTDGGVTGGLLERFILPEERWLEFKVRVAALTAAAWRLAAVQAASRHERSVSPLAPRSLPHAPQVSMDNGAGGREEAWLARSQLKGQGDAPLKAFLKRLRTCVQCSSRQQLPQQPVLPSGLTS